MHTVRIERLTHGPFGLGHIDGKVMLVPHTAPGDLVRVSVVEERKRYVVAEVVSLIEPGLSRTTPPCPYVDRCGGCSWQHVDYETQSSSKWSNVVDALERTAKLARVEVLPILRPSETYHYRRRIRLHARAGALGFRRLHAHDIVPVDHCLTAQPSVSNAVPLAARLANTLRTRVASIEIVGSRAPEVILVGRTGRAFEQGDEQLCRQFCDSEPTLAGIVLSGRKWRRHWGEDQISYSVGPSTNLTIDADAFSQINTIGNRRLVDELLQWSRFDARDRVLELYSGAGNLTIPIARSAGRVLAVEAHDALVRNGTKNSRLHGLGNVEWLCQNAHKAVLDLAARHTTFENVVLNPPRAGAKEVVGNLHRLGARRIFYIACDPSTMARDIGALALAGFQLQRVRPVDLFPQTHHVEILAELAIAGDTAPGKP